MEDSLKNIKLELDYYDENGSHSTKLTTIKLNTPKLKNKSHVLSKKMLYEMSFSLVLPDHIHTLILGKNVPVFNMSRVAESKTYSDDFSKTIKSDSIEKLTEKYYEIISDYKWLKDIDSANLEKVIFYHFETENREYKSTWNGIDLGFENHLKYKHSIGYISESKAGKYTRYNHLKKLINHYHESEFYDYKYIKWSEERESFFKNISYSLTNISDRIKKFEDSISEESINKMIENNPKLLHINIKS